MKAGMILMIAAGLAWSAIGRAETEDQKLEGFFREYLAGYFQQHPLEATRLGDHRFDHLLDDVSAPARHQWIEYTRQTLAKLPQAVDPQKLSASARVDYEILRHDLEASLWLLTETHLYEEDPRVYNDYLNESVYLLLAQSTLPKETNVTHALARMAQIPKVIAAARQNLKQPFRTHTETAIRQNRGAIGFYQQDLFTLAGKTRQLKELKAAAATVVASLQEYQDFLEKELLPQTTDQWRLGREKFARKLELTLNAGLTADAVLAEAERECARVEGEMYVIARQLWSRFYPGKPLPPDDADGRRFTVQQVLNGIAKDHGTPESLVRDTRRTVAQIKKLIAERDLLRLPEPDRCEIIEMPEFQRGNSTAYMNSPPPLDPQANGFYAVSPPPRDWDAQRVKSFFEEYNRCMLQILTIHEAYPGHYVQYEYGNRHPSLIRKVLASGVYVEGWAVYTEQMLLDQGYGAGDLALRLTQLKFYLRAVVNAILDHRMHCTEMTDSEALELLTKRAFQSEGEARLKVIRAKQSSCQLSTYFVGRMAHYRLRQQVQRELGDQFSLGRYHEAVLEQGPVPVKYLPELVRERLRQPRG